MHISVYVYIYMYICKKFAKKTIKSPSFVSNVAAVVRPRGRKFEPRATTATASFATVKALMLASYYGSPLM